MNLLKQSRSWKCNATLSCNTHLMFTSGLAKSANVYSVAFRLKCKYWVNDSQKHRHQSSETARKPWVKGVATSERLLHESYVGTDLLLMRVIHCVSRGPDLCSCWELLAGGFKVGFGLICRTQALYCAGLSMTAVIGDSDVSHHLGHHHH